MDIGSVIKAPFEDQDWIKKVLLMGLVNGLLCMTGIGAFVGLPNLLGWSVTYARGRMNGDNQIPEFGFGYIGLGYRFILSMLVYGVIAVVIMLVLGGVGAGLAKIADVLALVWMPVQLVAMLGIVLLGAPMAYRFIVHEDTMAGMRVGWAIGFLKSNLVPVLMFVLIGLVCGLLAGVMGIVPLIGSLFGFALSHLWNGAAIAELARTTNRA